MCPTPSGRTKKPHIGNEIAERKQMSAIDAYSLMSLTMNSRLGDIADAKKTVHCPVPKNLWAS